MEKACATEPRAAVERRAKAVSGSHVPPQATATRPPPHTRFAPAPPGARSTRRPTSGCRSRRPSGGRAGRSRSAARGRRAGRRARAPRAASRGRRPPVGAWRDLRMGRVHSWVVGTHGKGRVQRAATTTVEALASRRAGRFEVQSRELLTWMDVENLRETATERMRYIGSSGTGCVSAWHGREGGTREHHITAWMTE